jgi:hypothetical protein
MYILIPLVETGHPTLLYFGRMQMPVDVKKAPRKKRQIKLSVDF